MTMRKQIVKKWAPLAVLVLLFLFAAAFLAQAQASTLFRNWASSNALVVCSSEVKDTGRCDFVTDGVDDQAEINQAIAELPASGGKVLLTEGTFSINGVAGTYGGVLINRNNIVLEGSGTATLLKLTDGNTDKNVIRIANKAENVIIRDLRIDGNRYKQSHSQPSGQPFEANGIRAGATGAPAANIVVENVRVESCRQLCIMLFVKGGSVRNNWVGHAHSDTVEMLVGPGEIAHNYFEINGNNAGVVISTDAADNIGIVGNVIRVTNNGNVGVAIRTWAGFYGNNVQSNTIIAEPGTKISTAMSISTSQSLVSGNTVRGGQTEVALVGNSILFSDNMFQNAAKITVSGNDTAIINNYFVAKPAIQGTGKNTIVNGNIGYTPIQAAFVDEAVPNTVNGNTNYP